MCKVYKVREDLEKRLGHSITASSSRTGLEFRFGYAFVQVADLHTFGRVMEGEAASKRLLVKGRKEGDKAPFPKTTRAFGKDCISGDWYSAFLDWAVKILSTGRTVECGKGIGLEELQRDSPRGIQTCDIDLKRIHDFFYPEEDKTFDLDLDPPYQRGHVWTEEQASRYVGFLIQAGKGSPLVPLIFIQRDESFTRNDEVIDGKQRLTAMSRWVHDEIPATVEGCNYWYRDTTRLERLRLPSFKVAYIDLTERQRLRFYLLLNAGGTIHTETEIGKVRTMLGALDGEAE